MDPAAAAAAAGGGGGGENKAEVAVKKAKGWVGWVIPLLRVVAFCATVSATIVMALNKQTKTMVVATIGTTPITATLTAKFQHTPAFVFFVIANGMASLHNFLMLVLELCGHKYDFRGLRLVTIPILDMMAASLLSAGGSGAAFMGELGRNGNSHARWNKICDKFDSFCDHGSGALIASFIGLLFLILLNAISIFKLRTLNSLTYSVVP